ncbi:serine/threonine-protein kinase D6PKL2-like [Galendromus occidentalis]|uniref:Serine/threonine-protein kinase D6PKL2-like n=1 Tax=Galendromus occidentalis TaxID=34638 RepID=A0AAJ6QVS1_9ACAR|nr:serine/threonine-protein kinase D6PKL2-like [Galendromus occidentalis]
MSHSGKLSVLKCNERRTRKRAAKNIRLRRELNVWKALSSHPNVTNLYASFETERYLCYVVQYVPFRSLDDLIRHGVTFERRALKKVFAELASVLHTMHAVGIMHREITCSNVLLSRGHSCLLGDFSSSAVATLRRRRTGSLAFMAPEMLARRSYNKAADWWSYGIVLYAINHKFTPLAMHLRNNGVDLEDLSEGDRHRLAANVKVRVDAGLAMATKSFITELLQEEPESRLGARHGDFDLLRNHPFFIGYDWHHLIAAESEIIASPTTSSLLGDCSDSSALSGRDHSNGQTATQD